MKSNIDTLNYTWNSLQSYISQEDTSLYDVNINKIVEDIFCPGPFYYYVIDFTSREVLHASPKVKDILGINPENFTLSKLASIIHPEDIPHVQNCMKVVVNFLYEKVGKEKIPKYKRSYLLRIRKRDGSYSMFLHQLVVLTTNLEGKVGKVLGIHTDVSHITDKNNYKISFIGLNGEPSYFNIDTRNSTYILEKDTIPLTKREKEVIKLLSEGYSSNQIADTLDIAFDTVRQHRKNALSKTECQNTTQLVAKSIREGWI